MTDEQREELEVLESIYDDKFTIINETFPIRLRIAGIVGNGVGVDLEVEFTPNYPHELPIFNILPVSGRLSDSESLRKFVLEEAQKSLGMAMVFTLVSAIETWFTHNTKPVSDKSVTVSRQIKPSNEREEEGVHLTMEGGPVTKETFENWKRTFLVDMALKGQTKEQQRFDSQRLTGRQLFEQNKSLSSSDMNFGLMDEAVIDENYEELFEGLDELEIIDDSDIVEIE